MGSLTPIAELISATASQHFSFLPGTGGFCSFMPAMHAITSKDVQALVQPAMQANKEHQYALKVYTERLEAELEHLDKLLVSLPQYT